jgi:hypothetical protein
VKVKVKVKLIRELADQPEGKAGGKGKGKGVKVKVKVKVKLKVKLIRELADQLSPGNIVIKGKPRSSSSLQAVSAPATQSGTPYSTLASIPFAVALLQI